MDKKIEIEKLKKQLEKEAQSEYPDKQLIEQLKRRIFQVGLGLTLNDIKKI